MHKDQLCFLSRSFHFVSYDFTYIIQTSQLREYASSQEYSVQLLTIL
jgi:hypothetical protein